MCLGASLKFGNLKPHSDMSWYFRFVTFKMISHRSDSSTRHSWLAYFSRLSLWLPLGSVSMIKLAVSEIVDVMTVNVWLYTFQAPIYNLAMKRNDCSLLTTDVPDWLRSLN